MSDERVRFFSKDGVRTIHESLYRVRLDLERRELARAEDFEEYAALKTSPVRLDHDRTTHAKAVASLLIGIERALDTEPERPSYRSDRL